MTDLRSLRQPEQKGDSVLSLVLHGHAQEVKVPVLAPREPDEPLRVIVHSPGPASVPETALHRPDSSPSGLQIFPADQLDGELRHRDIEGVRRLGPMAWRVNPLRKVIIRHALLPAVESLQEGGEHRRRDGHGARDFQLCEQLLEIRRSLCRLAFRESTSLRLRRSEQGAKRNCKQNVFFHRSSPVPLIRHRPENLQECWDIQHEFWGAELDLATSTSSTGVNP